MTTKRPMTNEIIRYSTQVDDKKISVQLLINYHMSNWMNSLLCQIIYMEYWSLPTVGARHAVPLQPIMEHHANTMGY